MKAIPLAVDKRGEAIENIYYGSICVVSNDGQILYSAGDMELPIFTRSALKPIQAICLLDGALDYFGFGQEELALACGSHNGDELQEAVLRRMLDKIGLPVSTVKCGAQMPSDRSRRKHFQKTGISAGDIHNNCSGKHLAFLTACQFHNWPVDTYLDFEHPLQKKIRQLTATFFSIAEADLIHGEDGCSAPNYACDLPTLARAYARIGSAEFEDVKLKHACEELKKAMLAFPHYVAGTQRFCTDLMLAFPGRIIGKTGADGVYALLFVESGIALSLKIHDGSMGPQYAAVCQFLLASGFCEKLPDRLVFYTRRPIKNWNRHITGYQQAITEAFEGLPSLQF